MHRSRIQNHIYTFMYSSIYMSPLCIPIYIYIYLYDHTHIYIQYIYMQYIYIYKYIYMYIPCSSLFHHGWLFNFEQGPKALPSNAAAEPHNQRDISQGRPWMTKRHCKCKACKKQTPLDALHKLYIFTVSIYICIFSIRMYVYLYVSMYSCIYVSMHVCMHVCMYSCLCMYTCIFVYVCIHVFLSMYVCMCVCV